MKRLVLFAALLTAPFLAMTQHGSEHDHHHDHHHHHEDHGPVPVYDDQGFGFEVFHDPRTDLLEVPREGVLSGPAIFKAFSEDERFDFTYCPELQSPHNLNPPNAQTVVFCVTRGTGLLPWNLRESEKIARDGHLEPSELLPRFGPVQMTAGQTLRVVNLDTGEYGIHRLHVFDKPCYHQPRLMTQALYDDQEKLLAATYYDCPSKPGEAWNSEREDGRSWLYNHETKAPFYLNITLGDVE